MNILFINSIKMFAGGEVWMLRTMAGMDRRGHQVFLACRPNTELFERASSQRLPVFPVSFRGDFDPITILKLRWLMRRHNIDLVLTNMEKELRSAGVAARLGRRVPVISRRGIDHPLKNRLRYRFTYNQLASHIVANSEATKASLLRDTPWLRAERVSVIYNGIDPAEFEAADGGDVRSRLGLSPDDFLIGFVGQLDERKGIQDLLYAFRRLFAKHHRAHLFMVGAGPMAGTIWAFARRGGEDQHVHIWPFTDNVPEIMAALDVLCLPSLWEGFGIVLIEAMAAGKPVVATRVSSIPEIVADDISGLLVPINNPDALEEAFEQLLLQPGLRHKMGRAGREIMHSKFSIEEMLTAYEKLFMKLATLESLKGTGVG